MCCFKLGRSTIQLDNKLLKTKYPIEFSRSQRPIEDINRYKASEYRNLIFYNLVGNLNSLLKDKFYNHLLLYAVSLRILTKNYISDKDINDAHDLIVLFVKDFENLYGADMITFNLHAHLHLAKQVKLFGPLHKASGFPFEGMFQYSGKFRNGTRGLIRQTAQGIETDKFVHFQVPFEIENLRNPNLQSFIANTISKQSININSNFSEISFFELNVFEKNAISHKIIDILDKKVAVSEKAQHDKTGTYKFISEISQINCYELEKKI